MPPAPERNSQNDDGTAPESAAPEKAKSLGPISEEQLARLWQRRAARSRALRTEGGQRVRVLYPGRPGVTAGPDFRNALLAVDGQGLVQGDVEIHLRQQDWQAHGHHRDPNYNGVALHIALQPGGAPARTRGGATPPVVNPGSLLDETTGPDETGRDETGAEDNAAAVAETRARLWRMLAQCGYRRPGSREQMAALLNRAGDERFLSHSRRFQTLLAAQSAGQTLWEAICEGLGYRHNRHPFLRLAAAAPIDDLMAIARRQPAGQRGEALTAHLLRLSGLDEDGPAALDRREWRLFRVRPSNHPRRRIAGAGALAARYADAGLVAGLERASAAGKPARLAEALTVKSDDGGPAPVGVGRARDLAVNAALPFLHARRTMDGDAAGAAAMLEVYRRCGPLTDNEITRELAATLQEPAWGRVADNARRQQGLIHLQRLLAGAGPAPII